MREGHHIGIRWLLDLQAAALKDPFVHDYSALQAAVARHRVITPNAGEACDAAWRAAALLHTLVLLEPLPSRNRAYACSVVVAYMHVVGESIDPPCGALVDLVREIRGKVVNVFEVAQRIRGWRV